MSGTSIEIRSKLLRYVEEMSQKTQEVAPQKTLHLETLPLASRAETTTPEVTTPREPITFHLAIPRPHVMAHESTMGRIEVLGLSDLTSRTDSPDSFPHPIFLFFQHLLFKRMDLSRLYFRKPLTNFRFHHLLPSESHVTKPTLDDYQQPYEELLDQANITLNPRLFLPAEGGKSDTALSSNGLKALMRHFSNAHGNRGIALSYSESLRITSEFNFVEFCTREGTNVLFCFDPRERHVTGAYFRRDKEGQKEVYLFDSMGLDLPAYPCGARGSGGSTLRPLKYICQLVIGQGIKVYVLPINLAMNVQSDPYSCLMATLFFFTGMHAKAFRKTSDQGLAFAWGKPPISISTKGSLTWRAMECEISLYTLSYLPFLAGIQSRMAFLLTLDSLGPEGDRMLKEVARLRTNWMDFRKISINIGVTTDEEHGFLINTWWSIAYIHLLKWLEKREFGVLEPFPDFLRLLEDQPRATEGVSPFELKVQEFLDAMAREGLTLPPPPTPDSDNESVDDDPTEERDPSPEPAGGAGSGDGSSTNAISTAVPAITLGLDAPEVAGPSPSSSSEPLLSGNAGTSSISNTSIPGAPAISIDTTNLVFTFPTTATTMTTLTKEQMELATIFRRHFLMGKKDYGSVSAALNDPS